MQCGDLRSSTAERVPFEDLPEFVELEDWEFEETIQEAQRLLHSVMQGPELGSADLKQLRTHGPHLRKGCGASRDAKNEVSIPREPAGPAASSVPWVLLALGLGVFVCGAALIGLSLLDQRPQLWQLGLPMALGGQVAILAVVIWQLDVAWNSHRATFVALHAVDNQLRRLREDEAHRPPRESTDSRAVSRPLAEEAGPDAVLADLQKQIQVLSTQLARDKRAA